MPDLKKVIEILKSAKQETIDGKKCFVLEWDDFLRVNEIMPGDTDLIDPRLGAQGYNNFQIRLTAGDHEVYYLVSKSGPILDGIWKETK